MAPECTLVSDPVCDRYWELMVIGGSVTMFLTGPVYYAVAKLCVQRNKHLHAMFRHAALCERINRCSQMKLATILCFVPDKQ